MFGTEPWGYGDYGQFRMVVWIILAVAFRGLGRLAPTIRFFVMRVHEPFVKNREHPAMDRVMETYNC
jgi:hypothetical protein